MGRDEVDVGFARDRLLSLNLGQPTPLRFYVGQSIPALHDPSPSMPHDARPGLVGAAQQGQQALEAHLTLHYPAVKAWWDQRPPNIRSALWAATRDG